MSNNPMNKAISDDGMQILQSVFDDVAELKAREMPLPPRRAYSYDAAGGLAIAGALQQIPFATQVYLDAGFGWTGTTQIDIGFDGIVELSFNVSIECVVFVNSSRFDVWARLNTIFVGGSFRSISINAAGLGNSVSYLGQFAVSNGDAIDVSALRSVGGTNGLTIVNGSNILIKRIN